MLQRKWNTCKSNKACTGSDLKLQNDDESNQRRPRYTDKRKQERPK